MKFFFSIITFFFVLITQSYSQNCNPDEYNDGMMIKEYEAEYNYKAEEAYLFGKKIQKLLLDKDLKGFIDVTTGDLKIDLEKRFREYQSLEVFFSPDALNKITQGKVYCKPMGISGAKTFWIGLSDLVYTLKDNRWLVTEYKNQDILEQDLSSNEDMQWLGSCYIEYDGKIIVNNEICSIRQNGFSITPSSYKHINDANDFQIVAVRDVPCDDGSKDCAYYFYADKHSVTGEILYQINYNIEKERSRYPANLGEDFTISEYKPNDTESGLCFLKDEDKFCFAYVYKETEVDSSASNLNQENPKLYCSHIKENGEFGDKNLYDLNSKSFKNLEISNSLIKFTFETNEYFVSSDLNKDTKLLNHNVYKDSERKILEFRQSWHCEDNQAKLEEFIQAPKKAEQTPKDKRTVTESKLDVAWKIDDKFIIPECFDYVWMSGDRYETFFDEYIEKLEASHWDEPRVQNFIINIGTYLNRSYLLYTDPKYSKNLRQKNPLAIQRAREALKSINKKTSDAEIEGILNSIIDKADLKLNDVIDSLGDSKIKFTTDSKALKKRKDIIPELRAMMGEIEDPFANFAQTYSKLSNMINDYKLYKDLSDYALKEGIAIKTTKPLGSQYVLKIIKLTSVIC